MGGKKDSKGRTRHPNQNVGRAGLPAKGDGGRNLKCPNYFGAFGQEAWHEAIENLRDKGLMDHADSKCVEMFAGAYEEYREAREAVTMYGVLIEVDKGELGGTEMKRNPAAQQMENAWKRCVALFAEMGFSPASRRKFQDSGGEDKDELLDFMNEN